MDDPFELLDRTGKPVARNISLPDGTPVNIPVAPHRYLLVFWASTGNFNIFPEENSSADFAPMFVDRTNIVLPISFDTQNFGALPTMGFTVQATAPPTTVTIVEGYLFPQKPKPLAPCRFRVLRIRKR